MPIYEYACPDCEHQFEHIQKMSDPLLSECPSCGKQGLRKLVSATSFQLKGSGWYRDHYGLKPGNTSSGESETSSASSSSDSPSSSGSEKGSSTPSSNTGSSESGGETSS